MPVLIADTSALVSLGAATTEEPDPLGLCLETYEVHVPTIVIEELRDVASYDDAHGLAAATVFDRRDDIRMQSVSLDAEFPLDDGENAAVTLANETNASLFLCDEFNQLGLIHASLADTRLVTTPTLLTVFVRNDLMPSQAALSTLDSIGDVRSWENNSYVERARALLDGS